MTQPSRTFRITIAYDGAEYAGWQIQPDQPTVQKAIESALESVVGKHVSIVGSGRTDSGVHARGQVASFQLDAWSHSSERLLRALNTKMPPSIAIIDAAEAADGFHALGDATSKRYRYQLQVDGPRDPFSERWRWRVRGKLDVDAMAEAATRFLGQHDFASFEATGAPRKSTVRTIRHCQLVRQTDPDGWRTHIAIDVEADGFLYNMVRNIVGTIVEVGRGKHDPTWVDEVIAAKNRDAAGPTAPAWGLFLMWVRYDEA